MAIKLTTPKPGPWIQTPLTKDAKINGMISGWFERLREFLINGPKEIAGYAVADLPDPATYGDGSTYSTLVFVSDETGGAVLAFSDGTNWRRVTDRAIVS